MNSRNSAEFMSFKGAAGAVASPLRRVKNPDGLSHVSNHRDRCLRYTLSSRRGFDSLLFIRYHQQGLRQGWKFPIPLQAGHMLTRLKTIYAEFPPLFWIIVITLFIDSIGSTLLFPFFALYITQKFGVGMTEAGVLLGMSSLFGLIGSMIGGALTDKIGRRQLILFGLVFSALSSLLFGLMADVKILYFLVIIVDCFPESLRPPMTP
jgi:cyanate permease